MELGIHLGIVLFNHHLVSFSSYMNYSFGCTVMKFMFKNTSLASPVAFDTMSSPFMMLSVGHYGPQCGQRGYLSSVEGPKLE